MDIRKLIISLALCLGAGGIGAIFTMQSVDTWYGVLKKPFFTPPNWIFGPVWTVLYILMGLSIYIVWRKRRSVRQNTAAYLLFGTQLALNVGWSFIFFGMRSMLGGLFAILALWLAIIATIHEFLCRSQVAGWLLIPYLVWVSYACLLNLSIWWLNR
ncbi:MAG: tryptophan-rich sensory protein [Pelosinus sp.]|nr:tryptophan-rich sensory protein [Pelosinus sp.]